jgi:hypothetical protein
VLLAGCGSATQDATPVAWWHDLEGGPIAAQRPPPPGVHAPYPNLSTIPPKPKPIDPALQARTYAALAADRADATYEAKLDPLTATAPRADNGLFAPAKPLPPPSADTANAALDAATPTPPPAARPPAAKPTAQSKPAKAAPVAPNVDSPIPDIVADQTPLPTIPDAPPPPPVLPGLTIPVTAPAPPPKLPLAKPAPAAALTASEGAPVVIPFTTGSAVLTLNDQQALLALAFRRGTHGVEIIGFGEAEGLDPQSEVQGVRLGVARARAIAALLLGYSVPLTGMHLSAEASGRGAAVRLVD